MSTRPCAHASVIRIAAELAERLYAQVRRSLSPLTSELAPAGQRQLQTLLERLLARRDRERQPGER